MSDIIHPTPVWSQESDTTPKLHYPIASDINSINGPQSTLGSRLNR